MKNTLTPQEAQEMEWIFQSPLLEKLLLTRLYHELSTGHWATDRMLYLFLKREGVDIVSPADIDTEHLTSYFLGLYRQGLYGNHFPDHDAKWELIRWMRADFSTPSRLLCNENFNSVLVSLSHTSDFRIENEENERIIPLAKECIRILAMESEKDLGLRSMDGGLQWAHVRTGAILDPGTSQKREIV